MAEKTKTTKGRTKQPKGAQTTTERGRTKKGQSPKGTADVERTSDGVALATPAVYEPGNVQRGDKQITGFYRFKLEQLEFLREYAKDTDFKRAAKAVDVPVATARSWLSQEKFKAEIEEIHDVWRLNIKMTAENAAAKHIKLMQQLESDYMESDLELRAKFANPLTKASETYLKAAGHFNHGGGSGGESQVVINITGFSEDGVKIDGEKRSKEKE